MVNVDIQTFCWAYCSFWDRPSGLRRWPIHISNNVVTTTYHERSIEIKLHSSPGAASFIGIEEYIFGRAYCSIRVYLTFLPKPDLLIPQCSPSSFMYRQRPFYRLADTRLILINCREAISRQACSPIVFIAIDMLQSIIPTRSLQNWIAQENSGPLFSSYGDTGSQCSHSVQMSSQRHCQSEVVLLRWCSLVTYLYDDFAELTVRSTLMRQKFSFSCMLDIRSVTHIQQSLWTHTY